jgi:hypothetical protein
MGLCVYKGHHFLILINQFSSFPHIFECGKHATTKQVTDFITLLITFYSTLVLIYSNGGPQFDDFCKKWSINHIISSSHYLQSNAIAETTIKEMNKNFPHRVQPQVKDAR